MEEAKIKARAKKFSPHIFIRESEKSPTHIENIINRVMTEYKKDIEIINKICVNINNTIEKLIEFADAMEELILETEKEIAKDYTIETISNLEVLPHYDKIEELITLTNYYMCTRVKEEVLRRVYSEHKKKINNYKKGCFPII